MQHKEIKLGLRFTWYGDRYQIVQQQDLNYWLITRVGSPNSKPTLISTQDIEAAISKIPNYG